MSLISAGKALGVDYLVSSTSHAMQSTTIMRRTCASQPGAVLISPRAPAPPGASFTWTAINRTQFNLTEPMTLVWRSEAPPPEPPSPSSPDSLLTTGISDLLSDFSLV